MGRRRGEVPRLPRARSRRWPCARVPRAREPVPEKSPVSRLERGLESLRKIIPAPSPNSAAAVRARDDLEEVAARVLEVHAAAAVVVVDLALLALARIRPVVEPALLDAAEDLVELLLADEERVVLLLDLVIGVAEIERHAVRELDGEEIGA